MAYNFEYPYTDPYRANTDWEINSVKECIKAVRNIPQAIADYLKEHFAEYMVDAMYDADTETLTLGKFAQESIGFIKFIDVISAHTTVKDGRFNFVTPQDFGAVGDGVTDDTEAIQKAFDSGKPVMFASNYAVTSLTMDTGKPYYLNGNGFTIIALSREPVFKINAMYCFYENLRINGNLLQNSVAMEIWSGDVGSGHQSQFLKFDKIELLNFWTGIKFGHGNYNAQSEISFHALMFRSVCYGVVVNQPNGFLRFNECELDITPYEWSSVTINNPYVILHEQGTVSIDSCTLESPSQTDAYGIIAKSDVFMKNDIVECAGAFIHVPKDATNPYIYVDGCQITNTQATGCIETDSHAVISVTHCRTLGSNLNNVIDAKTWTEVYMDDVVCVGATATATSQVDYIDLHGVRILSGSRCSNNIVEIKSNDITLSCTGNYILSVFAKKTGDNPQIAVELKQNDTQKELRLLPNVGITESGTYANDVKFINIPDGVNKIRLFTVNCDAVWRIAFNPSYT